jgi:ubiquinone/menaquinone biosynthesis C-methylase UbiE
MIAVSGKRGSIAGQAAMKPATEEELWNECMLEYSHTGLIHTFLFSRFFSCIKEIIDSLPVNANILEVGCGAGESSERISRFCAGTRTLEISDYDERYISQLKKKRPHLKSSRESVYELKRPDNSFDCVIMLEVLEHLDNPHQALKEICRVSRDDVVISVPHESWWRILNMARLKFMGHLGNTPGHIQHFSIRKLKEITRTYGTDEKIFTPFPWIIMWLKKN